MPKWILDIYFAANKNWGSRIFTIIIIVLIGSGWIYYSSMPAKVKPADTFCEEQVKILTNALIDIKKDVNKALPTNTTSFHLMGGIESLAISFPYIDTLPRKKKSVVNKTSQPQQIQYQVALKTISNKIDSILRSVQQQQQQKHKN